MDHVLHDFEYVLVVFGIEDGLGLVGKRSRLGKLRDGLSPDVRNGVRGRDALAHFQGDAERGCPALVFEDAAAPVGNRALRVAGQCAV